MFQSSNFKPAIGLSNPHIQTLLAKYLNRNEVLSTINEILELPDGDFVELAWTETPQKNNTQPIIVLMHGLQGSKHSHYIKSMFKAIKQRGWIAVLIHFRGCGSKPNRLAHSYHSGYIDDIHYFSEQLELRYQHCKFAIMGFSLGGNVLTQYLAKTPKHPYVCAAVICAPLHLASCSNKINQGFSKNYQQYLLNSLKQSTGEKIKLDLIHHISLAALNQIKTMRDFDHYVTAPLNGFNSAEHYYQQSSGINVINAISSPCLFIHAKDDPFLAHQYIVSSDNLPSNITFEISAFGGHVGFLSNNAGQSNYLNDLSKASELNQTSNRASKGFKRLISSFTPRFIPHYWLETRIPQFLQDYL